jgi:hypothetical protein
MAILRPGVIVSTIISLFLVAVGIALIFWPKYGDLHYRSQSIALKIDVNARTRLVDVLTRVGRANGFDVDVTRGPQGPGYFWIDMIRKDRDIVVFAHMPSDDPHEVRVDIDQDDEDQATPARVDALTIEFIKAIDGMPGVKLSIPRPTAAQM